MHFALCTPVPNPTVMITSSVISPICPIGYNVTLTCSVELSPLVNVPVNVTAQLLGPAGVIITPVTNSVMESTTRYTSVVMIHSFRRAQSGEYICTATVELVTANPFIIGGAGVTGMDRIIIGTGKQKC